MLNSSVEPVHVQPGPCGGVTGGPTTLCPMLAPLAAW